MKSLKRSLTVLVLAVLLSFAAFGQVGGRVSKLSPAAQAQKDQLEQLVQASKGKQPPTYESNGGLITAINGKQLDIELYELAYSPDITVQELADGATLVQSKQTRSAAAGGLPRTVILAAFDGFIGAGVIESGGTEITRWTVVDWVYGVQRIQPLPDGRIFVQTYGGFRFLTLNPNTLRVTRSFNFGIGGLIGLSVVGSKRIFGFGSYTDPAFDAVMQDEKSYRQYASDFTPSVYPNAVKAHSNGRDLLVFDGPSQTLWAYIDAVNTGLSSPKPHSEFLGRGISDFTADGRYYFAPSIVNYPPCDECGERTEEPALIFTRDRVGGRLRALPITGLPSYSPSLDLGKDVNGNPALLVIQNPEYGPYGSGKAELSLFGIDGKTQHKILRNQFSFGQITWAVVFSQE